MVVKSVANDSGASTSYWMRTKVPIFDTPINDGQHVDVCVVGAGIAGLTTAAMLAADGARVAVLDDGPMGGGETGRTTAHLASAQDDRFTSLLRTHSVRTVKLLTEAHAAAIDRIESICVNENLECGFRRVDGYLFNPPNGSVPFLERELAAAKRAGLTDAELVTSVPLPGFSTGPAIRFPRQAQLHPIAYLRGLARWVERLGGALHGGAHVERIEPDGNRVTVFVDSGRKLTASSVVIATNAPIVSPVRLPMQMAAYRSYVIALRIQRGLVPLGLYWDTEDPYHYARLADDGDGPEDVLIVGGEDHRTGQAHDAESRWDRLERWTRERFPAAGRVIERWSGQILEPADGMAFIGRAPGEAENVYLITGDSGQGLTHGTIGGMLVADLVAGRDNPWTSVFDPGRAPVLSARTFLQENVNTAAQYFDWIRAGDVDTPEQIPFGSGAVLRRGVRLLAVYRDETGGLHSFSAKCPHLGGVVGWNASEKSWDCPCHGSRFSADGHVLNGPANTPLEPSPVDEPMHAHVRMRPSRS